MKFLLLLGMVLLFVGVNAQVWKPVYDSARQFEKDKKIDQAIEYYIKSKEILIKDSAFTFTNAGVNNQIAVLYQAKANYPKAEQYYKETQSIREKLNGKNSEEYIRASSNLNYLYVQMGKYEEAQKLCLETRDLAKTVVGENNYEYARTCRNLGMLNRTLGKFIEAESFFLEAQNIIGNVKGKDKIEYASITNDLGALYLLAGFSEKAVEQLIFAKDLFKILIGTTNSSYANVTNNLGLVYKNMEEYSKSEEYYLETKRIREGTDGPHHPNYAMCCYNLGDLHVILGRYEKAEESYLEAQKIYEVSPGKNHPEYARVCAKLGRVYSLTGKYEKAESLLLTAREIREKKLSKQNPEYALSLMFLGELYRNMEQYEQAKKYLLEAQDVYKSISFTEHPEYYNTFMGLAVIYNITGEYEKAESLLLEIKSIWDEVYGKESLSNKIVSEQLADVYWASKKPEKAIAAYEEAMKAEKLGIKKVFRFTTEKEQLSYIMNTADSYDRYQSFLMRAQQGQGQDAYDLSLLYRDMVLYSVKNTREKILANNNKDVINKFNNWLKIRNELAGFYSDPDNSGILKLREDSASNLEKELTRISGDFKNDLQETSWKNIQHSLKQGEAAIEFLSFQYYTGSRWTDSIYYIALVLQKDRPNPEPVYLFEKRQLDSVLGVKTATYDSRIDKLYSNSNLYNLIWLPLKNRLKEVSTIYYVPTGQLHLLNFSAISIGDNQTLGDKYRLVQLKTTASIVNRKDEKVSVSDDLLLYGGIKYITDSTSLKQAVKKYEKEEVITRSVVSAFTGPDEIQELPSSEIEVDAIGQKAKQKNFRSIIMKGLDANEESIKAINGSKSPAILHIATHGFFNNDPIKLKNKESLSGGKKFMLSNDPLMRSGLMLAGANNVWMGKPIKGVEDGILTGYEVSNLYLTNTKLVVLSACETGLGEVQKSEGVYGLQRAFKIAGVQNLIMSLWKVPDNTTSEFMQLFYEKLLEEKSIDEAFNLAQSTMRNKYRANPHKWAGMILIQ
jgi:CHAT domain-containing protein